MTAALVYRCLAAVTPATVYAFAFGCAGAVLFLYCFEIAARVSRRRPAPHNPHNPGRHEHTRPRYDTTR